MNIRIQVMANQARTAIQQVQGDLSRLAVAGAAGGAAVAGNRGLVGGMAAAGRQLTKMGSQLQWTGRQLSYNFTVPLAIAGAAGFKFANDNAKAMTRLVKVYGDGTMASSQLKKETQALGTYFEALSEKFGIARDQVIGIGADWAAAGSSGQALAKQVQLTLKTMVLGELDATTATQSLIAIQAQYGQSSSELADTVAKLNAVENQTGTTMGDLIQSMARSAGVARAAGVDVAHLAAMTAALVPAAGSASQAGNALKTIISRLLSPTKDAQDILGAMGIGISDLSWKSADAATRIQLLSKHFESLSDAQKGVVSATLASRYQINKFEVLMDAVKNAYDKNGKAASYYGKALDATKNRQKYLNIQTQELNAVLDSSPKKFDRVKIVLENTLADGIQPLLPFLIQLGNTIASVGKAFNSLPDGTKKTVIEFLFLLAIVGPLTSKIGALILLLGTLMRFTALLLKPLALLAVGLWKVVAAIAVAAWETFIGTIALLSTGLVRFAAASKVAGLAVIRFFAPAMIGMWAAVRTSWIVGLRSITSLFLAAMSVLWTGILYWMPLFRGMWLAPAKGWQMVLIPALKGIVFLFSTTMTALGVVMSAGATALRGVWTALSISLSVITAEIGSGLMRAWGFIFKGIEGVLIAGARALGIAWRATLVAMEVITAEASTGIAGIWRALQALLVTIQVAGGALLRGVAAASYAAFEAILLAAASVAGGIWRALQVGLVGITVAGGRAIAAATAITGRGLTMLWGAIGTAATGIWRVATTGLFRITKIVLFNIVTAVRLFGPALLAALSSPWTIAIVAVVAILYGFRDKLAGIWNGIVGFFQKIVGNVVRAFYQLPVGVQKAIMAVVNIVKTAAQKVYELFSYLNPFAHHSPSLVENVTNGMAVVRSEFAKITDIEGPINSAYASIARFKDAAKALAGAYDSIKTANEIKDLQDAGAPQALISAYADLAHRVSVLKDMQQGLSSAIASQQKVVKAWQDRLDAANAVLDKQQQKLSDLKDVASAYQDQISSLKDDLSTLTDTPIKGMGAFDDAIFANQQAQKRLQLQMLQTAQAGGQSYDDLKNNIASVQGEIEKLMGESASLRSKGAGSEILGQYDDQIKALKAQQKTLTGQANSVGDIQKQLDDLQNQGQILDLQKSLQFDGLTRQIQQAANSMKEMPFDQILAGVKKDQAGIAALTDKYNTANDAVNRQQKVVDAAQASVDSIKASYDAQNKSLQQLQDSYDTVTNAIQDMTQAMSDASSAAQGLNQAKLSPAMENFNAGAGGNFPDVGGSGLLGREGTDAQNLAGIDQMTSDLQKELSKSLGGFDLLGPFKDMWKKFTGWWSNTAWPFIKSIGEPFTHIFDGIDFGGMVSKVFGGINWSGIFGGIWKTIEHAVSIIWDFGKLLWSLLGPDITSILQTIFGFIKRTISNIVDVFHEVMSRVGPFLQAVNNIWNILKPFAMFLVGVVLVAFKMVFDVIKNVAGPVLNWLADMFQAIWKVILGVLDVFIGLFTGDWGRFWNGIKEIFGGIWDAIYATLKAILGVIWGLIKTVLGWIADIFTWLWDNVLHPIFDGIATVFMWLWNNVLSPYFSLWAAGWKLLMTGIKWVWDNVLHPVWNAIQSAASWLWNNALKPIFDAIGGAWSALGDGFKWVFDHIIHPIFDTFSRVIDTIKSGFQTAVDFIGQVWNTLGGILMKPVQWVIDFVWNNGLRKLWNWINNLWGGDDIAPFKLDFAVGGVVGSGTSGPGGTMKRLATGGVLPGYTPGRDVHQFFSPTGGRLNLSGGEAIMRPEFTRAIGIPGVDVLNRAAREGGTAGVLQTLGAMIGPERRYAKGGVIDLPGWLSTALKFVPGGGFITDVLNQINSGGEGGGNWGDMIWGLIKTTAGKVWDGIKEFFGFGENGTGGGGTGIAGLGSEDIKSFIRGVDPLPYIWGGVGPNGYDCSGLAGQVYAMVTGKPWYRRYFTTGSIGNGSQFGFRPGLGGILNLGFNDHHVVGEYGGLGFEAQSTATGILTGAAATNPNTMPKQMHLAKGGVMTLADLQKLMREGISIGGDPGSGPVFGNVFDSGGMMRGIGLNLTGRPERVLSPGQTRNFEKLTTVLDRVDFVKLEGRLNASETAGQSVVYNVQGDTTIINLNGDLVLPNIKDGKDAETFIQNLEDMAGGSKKS